METMIMPLFKRRKKTEDIPNAPEFLEFPEAVQYGTEEIPDFPSEKKPLERIKEWKKQDEKKGKQTNIRKIPVKMTKEITKTGGKLKPRSLFIKIEKFKDIVANINLISRRIEELEDIAQKIKEIKIKEDSEIADWQEQLNEIKVRLERIEESLESKI